MLIDIDQIDYASFDLNHLVVITLPEVRDHDRRFVEDLLRNLREKVDPKVQVLLLNEGCKVESIDEGTMRRMGWVRVTDTAATPDTPERASVAAPQDTSLLPVTDELPVD